MSLDVRENFLCYRQYILTLYRSERTGNLQGVSIQIGDGSLLMSWHSNLDRKPEDYSYTEIHYRLTRKDAQAWLEKCQKFEEREQLSISTAKRHQPQNFLRTF